MPDENAPSTGENAASTSTSTNTAGYNACFIGWKGEVAGEYVTIPGVWPMKLYYDAQGNVVNPYAPDGIFTPTERWGYVPLVPGQPCKLPLFIPELKEVIEKSRQFAKPEYAESITAQHAEIAAKSDAAGGDIGLYRRLARQMFDKLVAKGAVFLPDDYTGEEATAQSNG